MNYGAKLLGASLAIFHFLRLCGVLGDIIEHHKLPLATATHQSDSFTDYYYKSKAKVNDYNYNVKHTENKNPRAHTGGKVSGKDPLWTLGSSTSSMDKMRELVETYCPDCDPLAIDTFFETTYHPAEQGFSLVEEPSTPFSPESSSAAPAVDILCDFHDPGPQVQIQTQDGDQDVDDADERANSNPPASSCGGAQGCRYLNNNRTLICDSESMTKAPEFCGELDLFQLNNTAVVTLGPRAFGQSKFKTVKIHANSELKCFHPNAFQGVEDLRILSICNNDLGYVTLPSFKHLNSTYMLYLEHNKINLLSNSPEAGQSIWLKSTSTRAPISSTRSDPGSGSDWGRVDLDVLDEPVLPALQHLSLMGNPLLLIPKNYFSSLRYSPVRWLVLNSCQLKFIHSDALRHLPNLVELELCENPDLMDALYLAFEGLKGSKLETLLLKNNNLAHVPTAALEFVQDSLTTLDMSGNLFDALVADSFPSVLKNLKELNLDNCRIRTVEQLTFRNMVNLEKLVLTNNRLAHIPVSVAYLNNLRQLDVSNNVPAPTLSLSIGTFTSEFQIFPNIFSNMNKLTVLTLNHLPLKTIETHTFKGLLSLDVLSLESAEIGSIGLFSFQDLKRLRVLNLEGNSIRNIHANTFYGLEKLQTLSLQSNLIEIKQTPDGGNANPSYSHGYGDRESGNQDHIVGDQLASAQPFRYLVSLRWLHMGNNRVRTLYSTLFENMPALQLIDLSGNLITSWSSRVFNFSYARNDQDFPLSGQGTSKPQPKSPIEQLYLGNNKIGFISSAMLLDFQEIYQTAGIKENVDISDNPFVCDPMTCDLIKMVKNGTLSLMNWHDSSAYSCLDPTASVYARMCLDLAVCQEKVDPVTPAPTPNPDPDPDPKNSSSDPNSPTEPHGGSTEPGQGSWTDVPLTTTTTTLGTSLTESSSADPPFPPLVRGAETSTESWGLESGGGSARTLLILGLAFLSFVFVSLLLLIGYKKRFHLKYFWFVVRFNLVNIPNLNMASKRKASVSSTDFEYDIFVSYNHSDRGFIEDHLLPHIEGVNVGNCLDNGSSFFNRHPDHDIFQVGVYNTCVSFDSDTFDVESMGSQVQLTKSLSSSSSTSSLRSSSSLHSSLKVCIHERDFTVGVPITENIVDFVDRSRKVLVVVSKNYLESQWCLYEMNLAYHRLIESSRKSFIVILLEDIPVSLRTKSLNYLLLSRTYIEWPGEKASVSEQCLFWKRLKNSLLSE